MEAQLHGNKGSTMKVVSVRQNIASWVSARLTEPQPMVYGTMEDYPRNLREFDLRFGKIVGVLATTALAL
jgi:hypothetical protein